VRTPVLAYWGGEKKKEKERNKNKHPGEARVSGDQVHFGQKGREKSKWTNVQRCLKQKTKRRDVGHGGKKKVDTGQFGGGEDNLVDSGGMGEVRQTKRMRAVMLVMRKGKKGGRKKTKMGIFALKEKKEKKGNTRKKGGVKKTNYKEKNRKTIPGRGQKKKKKALQTGWGETSMTRKEIQGGRSRQKRGRGRKGQLPAQVQKTTVERSTRILEQRESQEYITTWRKGGK